MPSNDIITLGEREALVRATPAFRDLSVNEISQLSSLMQEVSYETGETVVTEDELIDAIYIIAQGSLEVTKEVKINGKSGTTFLAVLNPGESIGLKEGGLFSETGRRSATVKAILPSILLKIPLKDFNAFLMQHPLSLQSIKKTTDLVMKMQFIKASNPFMQLSNQRLAWLANSITFIDFNEGEIIFKQNDPADNCYMIVEGEVEFVVQEKHGQEKILNVLKNGELFGERALFKGAKRVATARAVKPCHLMVLNQEILEELKEEKVEISDVILSESAEYNRPIRKENIIHHHRQMPDGQMMTILKDPIHHQYVQLNDEGWFIWQQLNGQLSVQEIAKQFSKQFAHFDPQTVIKTIDMLVDEGFANADILQTATTGREGKTPSKELWFERFQFIYNIKNPDRKFEKLFNYGGFVLFNFISLGLIFLCLIAGLLLFPFSLSQTFHGLEHISYFILFLIWIVFLSSLLSLISPVAKALTIKYFKHTIPRFTIGWHFIFPVAFVDTSDLWLSSRFSRVMTILSGIIITLFIASLLSLFAYFFAPALTASLCSIFLYFLVLRSLDPLIESDGYHILMNILDAPKLRETAFDLLMKNFPQLELKNKNPVIRKQIMIYFSYYLAYILLTFIFITIIQYQLRPYALPFLWNGWMIYLLVAAGLIVEFFIEMNHVKKLNQIFITE